MGVASLVFLSKVFGRNALADLDGSTPECAQVCALHIGLHLEELIKIEMVAVHCTNETTPQREGRGTAAVLSCYR